MSLLVQEAVVALLVITCALCAAWRLATVRVRLSALGVLARVPGVRRAGWLARLRARTLAQATAACGGCSQAGTHPTPGAASRNRTPGALRR